MASQHILRIPRVDQDGSFVMVSVKSNGPHDLDLLLAGTESDSPYGVTLNSKKIKSQTTNNKASEDDWLLILASILLNQTDDPVKRNVVAGIELGASVTPEKSLDIIVRRITGNVTTRIGSISLPHNEDLELDLFDWVATASLAGTTAQTQITELQGRISEQQDTITKLRARLEEFVAASKDQEDAMAAQFALLLNEKKLKIRDQQRLLATAKVDLQTASTIQSTRESSAPHKPAPSRVSKRKAPAKSIEPKPESASDNDMQLSPESEDEDAKPAQMTPEPSESETEDDDDGGADALVHRQTAETEKASRTKGGRVTRATRATRGKTAEAKAETASQGKRKAAEKDPAKEPTQEEPIELPPRRELPFMKGKAAAKTGTGNAQVVNSMDDDDTDDDEL